MPGPGTDEPLVWYEGAGTGDRRWLHADTAGSVIGYSDATRASDAIYPYDPYGLPDSWAASASRYRYTGQLSIPEAHLYYYKARMYAPQNGRFLQTDPVGYQSDINLYAYVGNDPINGSDPSGLAPDPLTPNDKPSYTGGPDPGTPVQEVVVPGLTFNWGPAIEAAIANLANGLAPITLNGFGGEGPRSTMCSNALKTAGKTSAAVARANISMSTLSQAASANGIDPALLAVIGVRETGFQNIAQIGGGGGMGVFQLTKQPRVSPAQTYNLSFSANYASSMLSSNMNSLSTQFPNSTSPQLLQATAASYNL